MFLCHMPYRDIPSWDHGYLKQYERTLDFARRVRQDTDVEVFTILGPYPADFVRVYEAKGQEAAEDHIRRGLQRAFELIASGDAVALGEIGRPHFPVDPEVMVSCNRLIGEALVGAKEVDCAVVLHTESGKTAYREMAAIAEKVNFPKDRLVKHFSGPAVLKEENMGLFPSVLSREENVLEALEKGTRFMMETDFLDDRKRPGAVLSARTVPKRTKKMMEMGKMNEEQAHKIHQDNPEKVYGVEYD